MALVKSLTWSTTAFTLMPAVFFGVVGLVSGRDFTVRQFAEFWPFIIALALGFGAQAAPIKKSPLMIDEATFSELIERSGFVLESTGMDVAPSDKARAILQLYSQVKTQGKPFDLQAIRPVLDSFR